MIGPSEQSPKQPVLTTKTSSRPISFNVASNLSMTFIEWDDVHPVPPHTSTCLR